MSYNKIKALEDNVRAIETAVRIRQQGRQATTQEKETLSRYTGFGGIKEVLNIGTDKPIPNGLAEPIERLQSTLKNLADGNEQHYQSLTDGIKSSVLTAFYTPQFLIDAMAKQINSTFTQNDIPMRTFLEPSAGIGGFLPVAMPSTKRFAFEKDSVTGLILSLLHDETKVCVSGFETIAEQRLDSKTFDVIASNIPFGNFRVFDAEMWKKGGIYEQAAKTIHNYFFVKAMELLDEGGILAFVTSRGVADTTSNKFVRDYLVNHANLITALRLPDNLFIETGGFEVGSDLLIFQKNTHKAALSQREWLFMQVSKETVDTQGTTTEYANKIFSLPNHTLSTDSRIALNQYGKYIHKYQWNGEESAMAKRLADILKTDFDRHYRKSLLVSHGQTATVQPLLFDLFGNTTVEAKNRGTRPYTDKTQQWMKDGAMVLFEGQLGTLRMRKSSLYADTAVDFCPMPDNEAYRERANDYLPIREAYFELTIKEREEQCNLIKRGCNINCVKRQ